MEYSISLKKQKLEKSITNALAIYDIIMELTHDDILAIDTSSWCEIACTGEIYDHDLFEIEVM